MKELDEIKIPGPIRKVSVTDKTFGKKKQVIENLSLINFFYGNNGTGKTTVADTIYEMDSAHVEWGDKLGEGSFNKLIFNQDFIDGNIKQYGNMPGVYTISEEASTAQADIDKIEDDIKAAIKDEGEKEKTKTESGKKVEKLEKDYKEDISKAVEPYKLRYPLAITMKIPTIINGIAGYDNPQAQDQDEMTRLYNAAFTEDSKDYDDYQAYESFDVLDGIDNLDLLEKEIKSSGTTKYAELVKLLNNMVWVDEGHKNFQKHPENTKNLCPFCGEPLPDDIDDRIKSALDEDYQKDMSSLRTLQSEYKRKAAELLRALETTNKPNEIYPGIDPAEYDAKVSIIRGMIASNEQFIQEKINDPSKKITINLLKSLLQDLKTQVEKYNKLIDANNAVRKKKSANQKKFKDMFYEQLALDFAISKKRYETEKTKAEAEATKATVEYNEAVIKREKAEEKRKDIKVGIDTSKAIGEINAVLKDVGFLGFKLVPHKTVKYAYVMERTDGKPAQDPSEGEKNFIAFLYFYEKVRGHGIIDSSTTVDAGDEEDKLSIPEKKRKIVIIDDPVSSMDSGTMYVVGNLIRDLVTSCERSVTTEKDDIAQLFIFSHNAFFFRDITYNRVKDFEYVNFYAIDKKEEKSAVKICIKSTRHPDPKKAWVNDIPVKDNYNALWDEYRSANSVTSLTNIIRRILEYYYLQMCGYEGENVYAKVIDDNRKLFTESELKVADSLLKYLDNEFHWLNDGLYYSDSAITSDVCRRVFQKIFLYSGQDQHYRKMAQDDISDDIRVAYEKKFESVSTDGEELELSEADESEADNKELNENE